MEREMLAPRDQSTAGGDFLPGRAEDTWSHFAAPLEGWFAVASAALVAGAGVDGGGGGGGAPPPEEASGRKKRKGKGKGKRKRGASAATASAAAASAQTGDGVLKDRSMRFVSEWREAVLAVLRNAELPGVPMLGVCAAFATKGVDKPREWNKLASIMAALRLGDRELAGRLGVALR